MGRKMVIGARADGIGRIISNNERASHQAEPSSSHFSEKRASHRLNEAFPRGVYHFFIEE
jgi:hypothetical protein